MTASPDLAAFLLARWDEDGAAAKQVKAVGSCEPAYDPDRVLADIESKRRMLEMADRQASMCPAGDWPESGDMSLAAVADSARWYLRALARPFRDHPEFQETWL